MITTEQTRRCWDVDRDASFADVSSWCLERRGVNRLIVAVRPYIDVHNQVRFDPLIHKSAMNVFGKNIIRSASAKAWPGTRLIEHVGKVYVVNFDAAVRQRMVDTANDLRGWTQWSKPPLPEDICLYRDGDEWPVLVSVTHDGDAWLFDEHPDAPFVCVPTIILPTSLIPSPPDFIFEAN